MASAAALLKSSRKSAGLTQAELARLTGTTQPVIARLEREGSNPQLTTLKKMIAATGHTLELRTIGSSEIDEGAIAADLRASPEDRLGRFEELYEFARGFGGIALRADGP